MSNPLVDQANALATGLSALARSAAPNSGMAALALLLAQEHCEYLAKTELPAEAFAAYLVAREEFRKACAETAAHTLRVAARGWS